MDEGRGRGAAGWGGGPEMDGERVRGRGVGPGRVRTFPAFSAAPAPPHNRLQNEGATPNGAAAWSAASSWLHSCFSETIVFLVFSWKRCSRYASMPATCETAHAAWHEHTRSRRSV